MGWEHLLAFNLALIAAVAAPGPALLYFMRETLAHGPRAGIVTAPGLALSATTWTMAALVGLHGLFALFPWAYVAMKTGGALFLIWIAWRTWREAGAPVSAARPGAARLRALRAYLINMGNPKSVLFAAAVLVVVFPPGLALHEKALIGLNHPATEMAFYSVCAFALSRPAVSALYLRARRWLDRFASVVMGALGFRLLLDR